MQNFSVYYKNDDEVLLIQIIENETFEEYNLNIDDNYIVMLNNKYIKDVKTFIEMFDSALNFENDMSYIINQKTDYIIFKFISSHKFMSFEIDMRVECKKNNDINKLTKLNKKLKQDIETYKKTSEETEQELFNMILLLKDEISELKTKINLDKEENEYKLQCERFLKKMEKMNHCNILDNNYNLNILQKSINMDEIIKLDIIKFLYDNYKHYNINFISHTVDLAFSPIDDTTFKNNKIEDDLINYFITKGKIYDKEMLEKKFNAKIEQYKTYFTNSHSHPNQNEWRYYMRKIYKQIFNEEMKY